MESIGGREPITLLIDGVCVSECRYSGSLGMTEISLVSDLIPEWFQIQCPSVSDLKCVVFHLSHNTVAGTIGKMSHILVRF